MSDPEPQLSAGKYVKAGHDDFVDPVLITRSARRPPPSKPDNGPVDRVQEAGLVEQSRNFVRQERTEILGGLFNFVGDLGSSVNEGNEVLEIVAAKMITFSTPVPSLQLRCNQVRRRDRLYLPAGWEQESRCLVEGRSLPSILKAEDRRVIWHEVDK